MKRFLPRNQNWCAIKNYLIPLLLLAGCDSSESVTTPSDPEPNAVRIVSIQAIAWPDMRPNSTPWDDASAPDLYAVVKKGPGIVYTTPSAPDGTTPVWTSDIPALLPSFNSFELWDADDTGDELMGESDDAPFDVSSQPASVTVGGDVTVRIELEWYVAE